MGLALSVRQREWLAVIEAQGRSGITQRAWCSERGIAPGTFAWWKHSLRGVANGTAVGFVDVIVAEGVEEATVSIVLRDSGHRIVVEPGFDDRTLRRVVAALEGTSP